MVSKDSQLFSLNRRHQEMLIEIRTLEGKLTDAYARISALKAELGDLKADRSRGWLARINALKEELES